MEKGMFILYRKKKLFFFLEYVFGYCKSKIVDIECFVSCMRMYLIFYFSCNVNLIIIILFDY